MGQMQESVRKTLEICLGFTEIPLVGMNGEKLSPTLSFALKYAPFFGVSPAWLFLGLGEMRSKDAMLNNCDSTTEFSIVKDYARFQKLQEKVESQDRDLKEIYSENRELYKSQATLLRENGELKVTVAQLKEQLKVAEGGQAGRRCHQSPVGIVEGIERRELLRFMILKLAENYKPDSRNEAG